MKCYAEQLGIRYSCSTFDTTSAKEIIELNPDYIKVPSACNNVEMLKVLRDNYSGNVHISFGMTTKQQQHEIFNFFNSMIKL